MEVESDRAGFDTEFREGVLSFVKLVRRVKESLGWDAADVEAGTTESTALLDADSLHAFLASLDGSNVAAGTTTDDCEVVLAVSEGHARELHERHGVSFAGKQACLL